VLKLNLGCGSEEILSGYINVDIRPVHTAVRIDDIIYLSTFESNIVDEVRASHCIEHIPVEHIQTAVNNWARVLKPSGVLFVYCPDGHLIAQDLIDSRINIRDFSYYIFGAQTYNENLHRAAFDYERLVDVVQKAGLTVIGPAKRPKCYRYELGIHCIK